MLPLIKLKIISKYNNISGYLIYFSIGIVLISLLFKFWYVIFVLIIYLIFIKKNFDYLFKYLIYFLIIIFLLFFKTLYMDTPNIPKNTNYIEGFVRSIPNEGEYNNSFYLKYQNELILVRTNFNVNLGDYVYLDGYVYEPDSLNTEGVFNYKEYLFNKNVHYIFNADKVEVINKFSIFKLRYYLLEYINNNFDDNSSTYIKSLILGDKSMFDDNLLNSINKIGISHLFAISGLHVGLIVLFINKILKYLNLSDKKIFYIISIFLLIYMNLTGLSSSVIRASLMIIAYLFLKYKNIKFDNLDLLSIIFGFLILINPLYIYQVGFQLSFLITISLLLSNTIFKKSNNMYIQLITVTLIAYFMGLPITIGLNNEVNFLTLIYNFIYVLIFTSFIIPFTFIVFFIPLLSKVYSFFISIINESIINLSNIDYLTINMKDNNILIYFVYYLLLIYIFSKIENNKNIIKECFYFVLLFIFMWGNNYISFTTKVDFLDVGNGDSIIINNPFNQCNIMIDTSNYEGKDLSIPYLKSRGITKLDYLIITHSHSDHLNGVWDLIENNYIDTLVISYYEKDSLEDLLLIVKKHNIKIVLLKAGDNLKCGNINFLVISPNQNYNDANNNSLVLYSKIGTDKYLFTGDIEKDVELDIIKYDFEVDVLKVAHHGSVTSSTEEYIQKYKPDYSIISVGSYNSYGHPSPLVLERLENVNTNIYLTKDDGSIKFIYFGKIFKIIRHN